MTHVLSEVSWKWHAPAPGQSLFQNKHTWLKPASCCVACAEHDEEGDEDDDEEDEEDEEEDEDEDEDGEEAYDEDGSDMDGHMPVSSLLTSHKPLSCWYGMRYQHGCRHSC